MKILYLLFFIFLLMHTSSGQKYWTGGGASGQWNDGNNWSGGTVPAATDNVVLNNSFVSANYIITLPGGSVNTVINTLAIIPNAGNTIRLILPISNTAAPGLTINQTSDDGIIINDGGILENSNNASSGISISITSPATIRINNGGRYIHNNNLSASGIVNNLSIVPGTELGVIEYAQGASSALLSNSITYNSIEFTTTGSRTFSFSGNSAVTVRGFFKINSGITFNSTKNGNINIGGDLSIAGSINLTPSSNIGLERSLNFNGTTNQTISGTGNLTFGPNFRNLNIIKNAIVTLARNININNPADSVIVDTAATLNLSTYKIDGNCNFITLPLAHLSIGDPNGINLIGNNSGNIQTTASRTFDTTSVYEYNGMGAQTTGSGLPSSVKNLILNKPDFNSLALTNAININDTLSLQKGFLTTTTSQFLKLRDTTAISSPASNYSSCCSLNNIGWEKSFINGPALIEINSTTAKWIPVGKISTDTSFAPVQFIKPNTTLVTNSVEYFPASYTDTNTNHLPLDHISKLEYWKVACNLPSPSNAAQLSLSWRPGSKIGDANAAHDAQALTDLRIAHYFDDDGAGGNPFRWNIEGGSLSVFTVATNSSVQYGFITSNNAMPATTFYTFGTISVFNALPVKLVSFSGVVKNKSIILNWLVEDESAIDKYIIEKSSDGINFSQFATVNSLKKKLEWAYSSFDDSPLNGWNFCRLKINDEKNKEYYSKIIRVWFEKNNGLLVYPNPAKNEITIQLPTTGSVWIIEIVNSSGQIIKQIITSSSQKINIESLPKGIYFLYFNNQQQKLAQRFIKQ